MRDKAMDHRFSLVQGKFIGTLARIHVIGLAAHWSLGCNSLFNLTKGQRASQMSSSQEQVRGQVTYFKRNSHYQLGISCRTDTAVSAPPR